MSVTTAEMKFYKALTINDTVANGGLMSANTYTSGAVQNVFQNVLSAERLAGSNKYRKLFCKVANDADETLYANTFWIHAPTAGADWVVFFAGTQTNTQSDITGSERIYGSSVLATSVAASATTVVVNVEDATTTGIFQVGDTIHITDKLTPSSTTGNEETAEIDSIAAVSGTQVTMTLTAGLLNGYTASLTTVSSVYEPGDVLCSVDNWVETGAFTYDETTYPVVCDNIGTVEQTWTLTFTNSTTFTVSGNTVGSVGSGNITTDFVPVNSAFAKPFFTLAFAGWGGSPAAGNTLVFKTHPAAVPIWEKKVTPANCASITGNNVYLVWGGETL